MMNVRYLLPILLFLAGCDGFKEGYKKGYDSSFTASFKSSFISNCSGGDTERTALCECGADAMLAKYPIEQLQAPNTVAMTDLKDVIMPACEAKLSAPAAASAQSGPES